MASRLRAIRQSRSAANKEWARDRQREGGFHHPCLGGQWTNSISISHLHGEGMHRVWGFLLALPRKPRQQELHWSLPRFYHKSYKNSYTKQCVRIFFPLSGNPSHSQEFFSFFFPYWPSIKSFAYPHLELKNHWLLVAIDFPTPTVVV